MKKTNLLLAILLIASTGFASGEIGGGFDYDLIDSVTRLYRVRFNYFIRCNTDLTQPSITVTSVFPNGCAGNTYTFNRITQPPANTLAKVVTPTCAPNLANNCTSPPGTIQGIHQYIYEGLIQFPSGCDYVELSTTSCCRSGPYINTLSSFASSNTYYKTLINLKSGNNSVRFNNLVYPVTGYGNKLQFNFGGDEKDNDSIVYSFFAPLTAANNASVIYQTGLSPARPITISESNIVMDMNTGQMEFTPTNSLESGLIAIQATEYRKTKLANGTDTVILTGINTIETSIAFYFPLAKIKVEGVLNNGIKNGFYINNNKIQLCNLGDTVQFKVMATAENLNSDNTIAINWDYANANAQYLYKNITYTVKKDTASAKDTLIALVKFIPAATLSGCRPIYLNVTNCLNGYFTNQKFVVSVCNTPMSFSPTLSMTADTNKICQGLPIKFKATQNLNAYYPTLSWFKNGILQGTGDSFNIQNIKNQDSIWCGVNSTNYCNTAIPKWHYTNKTKITVTDTIRAALQLTKDRDTLCLGDTINIQALAPSGSINPMYTWYVNNLPISNTGSSFSSSSLLQNDKIFAKIKLNQICVKKDSAYSDTIKIIKVNKVNINVTIADLNNPTCAGDAASIQLNPVNTGSQPNFYWYKNNVLVDSNTTSFQFIPANNDQVYARMKSSLACVVQNNILSNTLSYQITPISTPTIQLTGTNLNPCKNAPVMVSATYSNEGSNPKFYWYQNNYLVDSNKTQFQFLANNFNNIVCKLVSNKPCVIRNNIFSDTVFSFPSPPILSKVNIVCLTASIYQNETAVFYAKTIDMGSNPVFTWYINNQPIPNNNNDTIYIPRLKNNDTVYCKLSSTLNCALENPVTSNKIVMKVTSTITNYDKKNIEAAVYPNPFHSNIQLKSLVSNNTIQGYTIYNLYGSVLLSETFPIPVSYKNIDLYWIPSDIYNIEVITDQGILNTRLLKE